MAYGAAIAVIQSVRSVVESAARTPVAAAAASVGRVAVAEVGSVDADVAADVAGDVDGDDAHDSTVYDCSGRAFALLAPQSSWADVALCCRHLCYQPPFSERQPLDRSGNDDANVRAATNRWPHDGRSCSTENRKIWGWLAEFGGVPSHSISYL